MATLLDVLLFIHLIGFAMLFGGWFAQLRAEGWKIHPLMRDGSGLAFLAGFVMYIVAVSSDLQGRWHFEGIDNMWYGIKILVGAFIVVLVMMNMRKESISKGLFFGIGGLTLVNAAIGVFA